MKRITFFFISSIFLLQINLSTAQNLNEAIRYGTEQLNGSARFKALGGAFGALGGDLSALNINPAGSTVFVFNELGVTAGIQSYSNGASYFGTEFSDDKSAINVDQAGIILVFENLLSSKWTKLTFGFNYQLINNFNKRIYFEGTNPNHGIQDYFLENANGVPYNFDVSSNIDLEYNYQGNFGFREQQTYLALVSKLMDYNEENNSYIIPGSTDLGIYQNHLLYTKGNQSLYTFNFAGKYNEKLLSLIHI